MDAGGWCPEGRRAEDGIISPRYPLKELPDSDYKKRTSQNVVGSDGTVIFYFGFPAGGTEQTLYFCIKEQKPYLLIDAEELSMEKASSRIRRFIDSFMIGTLNIAGPRSSEENNAYPYTERVIMDVLR